MGATAATLVLAQLAVASTEARSAVAAKAADESVDERDKALAECDETVVLKNGDRDEASCAPLSRAEPQVARTNGFFPFPLAGLVAQAGLFSATIASNSKNCGKGNNSGTGGGSGGQNNGNCPASP